MDESFVASLLDRSTALRLTGRFAEALQILGEAINETKSSASIQVKLLRETARVLMTRGYPRTAKEHLEHAVETYQGSISEDSLLCLNVHLGYAVLVGCGDEVNGKIKGFLLKAETIVQREELCSDRDQVELIAHWCKIVIAYQNLCFREGEDPAKAFAPFIGRLIHSAAADRRYQDIWLLLPVYQKLEESQVVDKFLEGLLEYSDDVPAHIWAALAFERVLLSDDTSRVDCLDRAEVAFRMCEHHFGATEIRLQRIKHGLETAPDNLMALIQMLSFYLEADYPLGALRMAIDLLTLSLQRGRMGLYTNIQEVLHNVCSIAGITHERLLLEVQLLAALNQTTGRYSAVMELSDHVYEEASRRKYWTVVYLVGQIKSLALLQGGHPHQALQTAEEIARLCTEQRLKLRSTAAHHLAIIQGAQSFDDPALMVAHLQSVCNDLEAASESDLSNSEFLLAAEKLCFIAELQLRIARDASSRARSDFELALTHVRKTLDRARMLSDTSILQRKDRILIRGKCDELLVNINIMIGGQLSDDKEELEGVGVCDELIESYSELGMDMQKGTKYMMRAMCHTQRYQKEKDLRQRADILVLVEGDLQLATQIFESSDLLQLTIDARHSLSRVYKAAWELIGLDSALAFDQFEALEKVMDRRRRDLSALGNLTALLEKQRLSSGSQVDDLYSWAAGVSIARQDVDAVWHWSQKRKARALADVVGLGVMIPESVKSALAGIPEASELLKTLQSYSSSLTTASKGEKGYIRHHIQETEAALRVYPVFEKFLQLRDGEITGPSQLESLAELDGQHLASGRSLIFVDWISYRGDLFILTRNASEPGNGSHMSPIRINTGFVKAWLEQHFVDDDARRLCLLRDSLTDQNSSLRKLDCLLGNITQHSKEGDLLVFCPTSVLSALPLHALKVHHERLEREAYLMQRNPVVYAPCFLVQNVCLSRSLSPPTSKHKAFLGVYDKAKEAERIYAQLRGFVSKMSNAKSACGSIVTKNTLKSLVANAGLIHFHGHCKFQADNVLKQALILSDDTSEESSELHENQPRRASNDLENVSIAEQGEGLLAKKDSNTILPQLDLGSMHEEDDMLLNQEPEDTKTHFTVEEVFRLQLQDPLVVIIACESASQTISSGDEPLGLVPGLLCAGAASVVGASWPISSGAGRTFSQHFYHGLQQAQSQDVVDLAVLLQAAVSEIMDIPETSAPYYWAAFCLSGSWMQRSLDNLSPSR